jgi:formate dehydrogenase major subunit
MNETAKEFGHVFLPAASSFEKDGTFMNGERRIQRVRKAVATRGQSMPDWQIICEVAKAMGKGALFDYDDAEEIWDEVRSVWPAVAGITYAKLDDQGIQWPCPTLKHPGTDVLHIDRFAGGRTAELRCIDYLPSPEVTDEHYPFILTTGRARYAFNAGTMTGRTPNIELYPTDKVSLNPLDCVSLGIKEGDAVRLTSRYGEAALTLKLDPAVRAGEAFATFHDPRVFLNRLTGPNRDRLVNSPEYKLTAVRIEPTN